MKLYDLINCFSVDGILGKFFVVVAAAVIAGAVVAAVVAAAVVAGTVVAGAVVVGGAVVTGAGSLPDVILHTHDTFSNGGFLLVRDAI